MIVIYHQHFGKNVKPLLRRDRLLCSQFLKAYNLRLSKFKEMPENEKQGSYAHYD